MTNREKLIGLLVAFNNDCAWGRTEYDLTVDKIIKILTPPYEDFKDTLLEEKCYCCGSNLTLMGSINLEGELWLVKRCLTCGGYPVKEVYKLKDGV